ncbi:phospholipase/Carboxylesterase [Emticicia oligotrophica DSM 17448]|uniref:Phospholipase/Carboxylesterase n=1 Tax=Emticicia oligotrophica (strain DSM 17448 / CIP 109782 / MTCC 6937 / GPTSA100-15) TaxID=929562 RepID=A0ABM5N648_EMTOG|nr:lipase family protein [Emticicia oligotrophica]AFK04810.1 phospholipase/Carboxylesterase [Emticicia oligotrophica DSM 17448]
MKARFFKYFVISLTLVFITWSCEKTTKVDPQPQTLVSSTLVKELSKEQLIAALGSSLGAQASLFIRSGVKQYKIVYKTKNTDGTEIQASGALIVPSGTTSSDALPLVSYQHGTIFDDKQAPSYFTTDGEGTIASVLATLGYIVSAPDYIGYGASNNLPHTYEHREGLANASLDMLRAAKEVITNEKFNWNKNLYIAGYSEGGFASLSLQKKIEEETGTEFNLKASSCGAGAYNKTLSFKTLVSTPSSGNPQHNASYIWVLLTYDRIYKLNRPMTDYFAAPYAAQIQKEQQNARISGSLTTLLSDAVKKGISNGTDTALLNAVKDNDVFDWNPKTPTQLYHGTADTYVPFFNSQTAYDAMKKRGANNVELIPVQGGDHASSIQTYLLGTLSFFSNIK